MDGLETGGLVVVKVHVSSDASALPATSFTPSEPPLIVAVYVVPAARSASGFNVATLSVLLYATDAGTVVVPAVVPSVSVNVPGVSVEVSIPSENVAVTSAVSATPVASAAGDVSVTSGAVVSASSSSSSPPPVGSWKCQ